MSATRPGWEREEEFKKLSISELKRNFAHGKYVETTGECARYILEEKEEEEEKDRISKSLKLASDNVGSTKKLVTATQLLVLVTFLLVVITLIGIWHK